MTDTDRETPARTEDAASGEPRDPAAGRTSKPASDVESPGGGGGTDPDALDQSVGREDPVQGDARTRDGAI